MHFAAKFKDHWAVVALSAALVLPVGLLWSGCSPECVDIADCRSKGTGLTCVNGKCQKGDPGGRPDSGEGGGAGGGEGGGAGGGGGGGGGAGGGGGDAGTDAGTDAGADAGTDAGIVTQFVANLTGAQEVPPVISTASGSGTFTLSGLGDGGVQVAFNITHTLGTGNVTGGHIHSGPAGVNGGVIAALCGTPGQCNSPITGNVTVSAANAALIQDGRAYVNLHTSDNPNGELRGQIVRPGEKVYSAVLSGANNLSGPNLACTASDGGIFGGQCGVGFYASIDAGTVRYVGSWSAEVDGQSVHIHQGGPTTQSGPVENPPGELSRTGNSGVQGQFAYKHVFDGGYYVNVHTSDAGAGLVRGQIEPRE